jgi:putative addiction module component (TIGR02574 family)
MTRNAAEILRDALELPPEARAALAGSLIRSLDTEVDEDAEQAWEAEMVRRLQEIDAGKGTLIPWADARRRIVGP